MKDKELLDILKVCEKLKENTRHCILPNGRQESVAEHSWRMTLMAFFMQDAFSDINLEKVYSMCLIHDLGEAFTGDIPTFYKNTKDELHEDSVLDVWVSSLPTPYNTKMKELYQEMHDLQTKEAKVYKALDKLEALISHNESDISTWLPLEYELQRVYGNENVAFSSYLQHLRNTVREVSNQKIEEERKKGSSFLQELHKSKCITLQTYRIEELQEGIYHIEDHKSETPSSMYYIDGKEEGLWIDGGNPIKEGSIQEKECKYLLEELTYHKQLSIFLTHTHIDHIGLLLDKTIFENVKLHTIYLSKKDYVDNLDLGLLGVESLKNYTEQLCFVKDLDSIQIDGNAYKVLEAPPHTLGSCVLVLEKQKCMFTGDAFGSGYVWLFWNEQERPLETLRESLVHVYEHTKGFRIYAGHRYQQFLPNGPRELYAHYLMCMVEVIDGLKNGTTKSIPYTARNKEGDVLLEQEGNIAKICTNLKFVASFLEKK